MTNAFSRWLDTTMGNKKITGRDLARKIGTDDSTVSRWRSGRGVPSLENCMAIAQCLDVPPLRLAVTAGLLDGNLVHAEPLPVPEEFEDRELARKHIAKIPGLTSVSRRRLLEKFDELSGEQDQ